MTPYGKAGYIACLSVHTGSRATASFYPAPLEGQKGEKRVG
jgi:hypothetical protein